MPYRMYDHLSFQLKLLHCHVQSSQSVFFFVSAQPRGCECLHVTAKDNLVCQSPTRTIVPFAQKGTGSRTQTADKTGAQVYAFLQ